MSETDGAMVPDSGATGPLRVVVGLAQGLALYALFESFQAKVWPATDPALFSALCTIAVFVPLILISGLARLRPLALIGWAVAVAVICGALAAYDIYRDPAVPPVVARNLPSPPLGLALAAGLFIAHSLVMAAASDRRLVAHYPTYFGVSWKLGLQALMAALFAGVFWLVLLFGAELFKLVKIDALSRLIQQKWFWIPATTLALSYSLHMTDVRVGIIRGVRTLSCNLLSWLLPLLTMIAAAFVVVLPFVGIELLWNTRRASQILLVGAAGLIFLINAAYQDGTRGEDGGRDDARAMSRVLHLSIVIASAVLVVLVGLSAYGISLRVNQYGWTPDRVIATACATVAACYAIGYVLAVALQSRSLRPLATTNVATAILILATLLALLTPLADPARISVADQVRRLDDGRTTPDKFDYAFLRFGSGRFGADALKELAARKDAPVVAQRAADMLQQTNRYQAQRKLTHVSPDDRASNITVVRPSGQTLPRAFLETDWNSVQPGYTLPSCLTGRTKCDAILTDLDGDGLDEVILLPAPTGQASVFRSGNGTPWLQQGTLTNSACAGVREALIAGTFNAVPSPFRDIQVAGRTLTIVPRADCAVNGTAVTPKP